MANQEWENLITPKTDLLRYIRKGVLIVQKKPFYIVELIKEQNTAYVIVYKVHPGTDDNPQKLAVEEKKRINTFSPNTLLGNLANRLIPGKISRKWVPKPPVFIAPVVPNQVDTFTGKRESGFFEREEDRMVTEAGKKKLIRGDNTGVFIGLSSVTWDDKVTIPTDSLIKALIQHKQEEGNFFDLQGANENQSNPLSTYFNGGKL
ncbi:hypothetical protein HWC53_gp171 [Bacillus phage vB_BmeM-Goe8]|uniref:Uncharacterized protein n=1 Tax=Bacillus phage vB_BmeM-Goe8 TaxID=2593638 RepID=A0A516KMU2_9CAUD|nr:hypothetical protein HWC53_gp171 [Bacillus phage vB_BmeM-Goe8]QDP42918.1 hypothetical protein Goe8_c01450 [Bacillus phage vB_BmeM-Goe8]